MMQKMNLLAHPRTIVMERRRVRFAGCSMTDRCMGRFPGTQNECVPMDRPPATSAASLVQSSALRAKLQRIVRVSAKRNIGT
jgi:hypothetical protein